jgi:anti-sigma factor RsiW
MNDDELNELFEPLRAAKPSAEMRAANRDSAMGATPVTPWWRRTIEVPLPVALATAAAIFIAVGWDLTAGKSIQQTPQPGPAVANAIDDTLVASVDRQAPPSIYQSSTYVARVGFVERVTRYPAITE